MNEIKAFIKKHKFIIAILLFAIIKQLLVTSLPITAYPNQLADDNMMVEMSKNIRAKQWLGEYTSDTLVKGPAMPFILAVINYLGFSYINFMSLLYTIACIYFIFQIKNLFKSKKSLLAIYLVLLFNPISYGWWTLQRVYRNGITIIQTLFIIGSMFAMYQKLKNKKPIKMLPDAIICGISLATMWLTREDSIWILPFVVVVTGIIVVNIVLNYLKTKKFAIKKFAIAVLPIIMLFLSIQTVKLVNYGVYGTYVYNELNDGYFGKVLKIIYSVKTDEDIQYVTATRKKINMLYECSPTLNSIKPQLEESLDQWDYNDRTPGDTQVEDGWFWWSLKAAVENANMYENAQKSNEFYKNVYNEIKDAIKEGKLETQMTMPSNLMSPWKNRYLTELPVEVLKTTWYVLNFQDIKTISASSDIPNDVEGIEKFQAMTNDLSATKEPNEHLEKYVERVNAIGNIYKATGLAIAVISFIAYIILTIKLIKTKEKEKILNLWLLLTGVICSYIVLAIGVSYSQISAFFSRYYMYLSGAYPLISIFCMGNICYLLETIKWKKGRNLLWKKKN